VKGWPKLLLVALAALVAAQIWLRKAQPKFAVGERAPELALPDLAGRRVALGSLQGKVVAVNFWATWCPPCLEEIPALTEVWQALKAGGCFEILGVAEESASDDVAEAVRKLGIPYPVLLDREGTAVRDFKPAGYPSTFLVDAEGRVRRVFGGAVQRGPFEKVVRDLLPASCRGAG